MGDLLRLVEFDAGGRPYGIHNLNVAATAPGGRYLERGTLTFTPGPVQARARTRADRFGGSQHAGETRDNGTLAGTWHQRGSSVDDAMTQLEAFLAAVNLSDRPRYLEFRPEKASVAKTSYLEIRGPATVQPRYSYNALNGAFMLAAEVSFPTAPLVQGPPMRIRDTFTIAPDGSSPLDDYTDDGGKANLSIAGGQLQGTGAAAGVLHTARGYTYVDAQQTFKVTIGAALNIDVRLKARIVGANDFLYLRWTGATLSVTDRAGGAPVNLAAAAFAGAAATSYWIRLRCEGLVITAEIFTADPNPTAAPAASATTTLAGATATKYGTISSFLGFTLTTYNADYRFDDYRIEPFVRRLVATPATIDLPGIPGDAPAITDLELSAPSGGAPTFGLITWTRKPGAAVGGTQVPFGVIDLPAAAAYETGFANQALAGSLGGNVSRAALAAAGGTARLYVQIDPSTLSGDAWAGDIVPVDIMLCYYLPATAVGPRIAAWLEAIGGVSMPRQYTTPLGAPGRELVLPLTGTGWRRFTKLGTVLLDRTSVRASRLYLELTYGNGSSGNIDLDYLFCAPGRRRLTSPTGRAKDSSYPGLSAALAIKTILSDGRGRLRVSGEDPGLDVPSTPMGGNRLELEPGDQQIAVKLSSMVPDDPTAQDVQETSQETVTIAANPTPRWLHLRA